MSIEGLPALERRLRAISDQHALLRELQLATVAEAKRLVPRKTGNLARTIRPGTISRDAALVRAGGTSQVGYAAYVELGTRAHDIVPTRAKVLAWGGERRLSGRLRSGAKATHFARRVHHPGTKAKPYLIPGAKYAVKKRGLADQIIAQWNRAA